MPIPLFVFILAGVLSVAAVVACGFWPTILQWAEESLLPWIDRNLPTFKRWVIDGLVALDKAASAIRRTAKSAWEKLSSFLVKMAVAIHRKSSNTYVRRVTTWMMTKLEAKPSATKIVTEEEVAFDDLPPEVRETMLRNGSSEIDVRELRTRELNEMVA
jgi:hypothetical protein